MNARRMRHPHGATAAGPRRSAPAAVVEATAAREVPGRGSGRAVKQEPAATWAAGSSPCAGAPASCRARPLAQAPMNSVAGPFSPIPAISEVGIFG